MRGLLLSLLLFLPASLLADCVVCHTDHDLATNDPHRFLGSQCTVCHRGNRATADMDQAHEGLLAQPAALEQARVACGACHQQQTHAVHQGLMHSGQGMVNITRYTFGEQTQATGDGHLAHLGHSPADSLLRKRCASCHLGQPRHHLLTEHPLGQRGGGCAACHLTPATDTGQHPLLSAASIPDERCVGCHSRSGRIALNYAGLAEVDDEALQRLPATQLGYLPDGRLIERKPADVHHRAGLACVDCHTARDVMGPTADYAYASDAVDIQCQDCHANHEPRLSLADWPSDLQLARQRIPFLATPEQPFLVTQRRQTPLWHIQITPQGFYLHRKQEGGRLPIPQLSPEQHPGLGDPQDAHARLHCTACHSQWAPQCHGCHIHYDPAEEQWDHVARAFTPGAWIERRWGIRNTAPPLGVNAANQIVPFVPGMIREIEHPDWDQPRFGRWFAPLAPHTTGPGAACLDCHQNPARLGLGLGELYQQAGQWQFRAQEPRLQDGLPADAWVNLEGQHGHATHPQARAFTPEELQRILNASGY